MLNLDLTAEQDMLRDMMRRVCARLSPFEKVRDLEDDPDGIARELWEQLGTLGVNGLMIPEEHGGSAMTMLDGVVIYEELGRSLAPVPHFVSCVLSAGAILKGGSHAQKSTLLNGLATGETIITPAWLEPGNGYSPKGVQTTAFIDGDEVVVNGSKMHVNFAQAADQLLVHARTGEAPTDVDLFLVPTDTVGVTLDQRMSIASDTQYRVELRDVRIPVANRIGEAGTGWATWDTVMLEAVILASAQAMGGADHALDVTTEYAKDRKQFDKALAEFQAISHYLADARTALDGGRILVHEAAWTHTQGADVGRLAPMAKLFTTTTYRDITAMAQQVFGGIGFTVEHDIQLHFRRAKQQQLNWWDPTTCEERIADTILTT